MPLSCQLRKPCTASPIGFGEKEWKPFSHGSGAGSGPSWDQPVGGTTTCGEHRVASIGAQVVGKLREERPLVVKEKKD